MEVQIRVEERWMTPQKWGQSFCSFLKVKFILMRIVCNRELHTWEKKMFVNLLSNTNHLIWQWCVSPDQTDSPPLWPITPTKLDGKRPNQRKLRNFTVEPHSVPQNTLTPITACYSAEQWHSSGSEWLGKKGLMEIWMHEAMRNFFFFFKYISHTSLWALPSTDLMDLDLRCDVVLVFFQDK